MSEISSTSELTTKEIVEQAIQDYHNAILPYLAKGNNGYSETPIGAMQMFDDDTAPSGWLVADGTVYDIDDYPFLANHYERVHGSKNYYGGDGTTTFAVPDWQGEFFRASGINSHANQGSGGAVGEHQDSTEVVKTYIAGPDGNYLVILRGVEENGSYANTNRDSVTKRSTKNIAINGSVSDAPDVAKETIRPTNTSLLCCIKAVPAGINYSLEEQEIGTWIDGKPLYQKTVSITTPSSTTQFNIDGMSDVENLVSMSGFLNPSNNWQGRINSMQDTSSFNFFNFNTDTKKFYFTAPSGSNYFSCNAVLIFQYTKTTDV